MPSELFPNIQNTAVLLNEDKWFFLICVLSFSLLFLLWISYIRFQTNRKVDNLKKELSHLEREVQTFRDRSRSNLEIFRKVVDGFEGILTNMRKSIDEEETKLRTLYVESGSSSEDTPILEKKDWTFIETKVLWSLI